MAYVNPYNPATPADGDVSSQGDDRIRELKAAMIERLLTVFTDINLDPLTFKPGIIPTAALADNSVTNPKLAADSVTNVKIKDDEITDDKILNVDGSKIINGSIDANKMAANSIATVSLIDSSVTTPKIADNSVTTPKIADGAVAGAKIPDGDLEIAKLSATAKSLIAQSKSVVVAVVTGNQGSDTSTEVGSQAFVGAKVGDAVEVGFQAAPGVEDKLQRWVAYVDAADHVKLYVVNTTGGNKTWSTCNIKLTINKPIDQW